MNPGELRPAQVRIAGAASIIADSMAAAPRIRADGRPQLPIAVDANSYAKFTPLPIVFTPPLPMVKFFSPSGKVSARV
jgi:hypothetical protein